MIKTFFHIILALSVFLSSGGFWISKHYCQGKYQKTTFIVGFGHCCSTESTDSCKTEESSCEKDHDEKEGCCHSESSFFQLEQDQQIEIVELRPLELKFIPNPIVLGFSVEIPNDSNIFSLLNYDPPPIVYDRQVRLQTFLC